ncbi:MAG: hypothetical protein V4679_05475 [Pseudomonadota bacterium]
MKILMELLVYIVLGALLAWPCWLLVRRVRHARRPLRCVQPYRPQLPPSTAATPSLAERPNE